MAYDFKDLYLVGIGSSAGGIEALKVFLPTLSEESLPVSYIIAQHLNPQYKSMLTEILSRNTGLEVQEISQGLHIQSNKIYVTPSNANVTVKNGKFEIAIPEQLIGPKPSIDTLFISLAQEKGERAVGIILSGTGSDGASGLKAIKASGGLTIAQDPKSSKYDGMPVAAIESKATEKILPPEEIGEYIKRYVSNEEMHDEEIEDVASISELHEVFSILNHSFDIDFSAYKTATIARRIERRMSSVKVKTLGEYLEYLKSNASEISLLYNDILIGVTSFYRDSEAFEALGNVLDGYIENLTTDEIRVWSAGCATGEEAYTIAMVISDIAEKYNKTLNIHIFATDIDDTSLGQARSGLYPEIIAASIPKKYIDRYFKRRGSYLEVVRALREKVIFSKHNLLRDPSFLRLDLVICRNLLIYFEAEVQQKTLLNFQHSLKPGGILFLGKSESLGKSSVYFSTLSSKFKIFKSRPDIKPQLFDILLPVTKKPSMHSKTVAKKEEGLEDVIKKTLLGSFVQKCVVVDDNANLMFVKGDLGGLASLPKGAINLNFTKMINTDLSVDFRSLLFKAAKNKTEQKSKGRVITLNGTQVKITIYIFPIPNPSSGYLVLFFEDEVGVSDIKIDENADEANKIKYLQDELDATKEHLQTVVEELETSNEELQATNEELQSSNEELQATNEELETSNEELQSSNEELQTAYIELKMVYEEQNKQRTILEEANRELVRLNSELNSREKYISALLDAEQAIVVVTRGGDEILDVNQGFFDFFSDFHTLEEFKLKYRCICELFENVSGDPSFLKKGGIEEDGQSWVEAIIGGQKRQRKALFVKNEKQYVFSVNVNQLDVINKKFVVVFSNITEIESERNRNLDQRQREIDKIAQLERVHIHRSTIFGINGFLQSATAQWRAPLVSLSNNIKELIEDAEYEPIDKQKLLGFQKASAASLRELLDAIDNTKDFFAISKSREYFDLGEAIAFIQEVYSSKKGNGAVIKSFENKEKIEYYGYIDEIRYLFQSIFGIYDNYFINEETTQLVLGLCKEGEYIKFSVSANDGQGDLYKYLQTLLVKSNTSEIDEDDFNAVRIKIVKSILDIELHGKIELKSEKNETRLFVFIKEKRF